MSQPNLIELIKEYCAGKIQLKEDTCQNKSCYILSGFAFPKEAVTPFKIYSKDDEHYSLESILYLLANKEANHSEYVKKAATAQIRAITRVDKRDIVEYLSGSKKELPSNYDQNVPPAIPISFERIQVGEPAAKKIKLEPRIQNEETVSSKPEITIKIKKESSVEEDVPLRQLNDDLTVDKIAELKRKKNLNQKKRIAPVREVIDVDELFNYEAEETKIFKTSLSLNIYVTRDNCMEAQTADFCKVLDIIESIKAGERNQLVLKKSGYLPARNDVKPSTAPTVQRYDRYDQKPALIIKDESLNISDGITTFIGKSIPAIASQNIVKKPAPRILLPPGPPPPKKRASKTPIIIVPQSGGMTGTLINKHNVKDILQDMTYCSPEEKKALARRESTDVQIHRRKGGMIVPYKIVENATLLSTEQWDRVVAVFVMGPAWQFKGWKWNGNPVEIFSQVPAFHLYYEDLEIDKNVAKWNVTAIPISRSKRHLDKARLAKIWDIVDKYIVKHKRHLRG